MDKKVIKTFAVNARNKLREDVKYQMNLIGITESELLKPSQKDNDREIYDVGGSNPKILYKKEINQRNSLIKIITEKGYDNVVEEVAYTWFNRIIAIRFMEVNNYLPTKIRVLSSETENKIEPDIVTEAPNIDLNLNKEEVDKVYSLKNENKLDELFQFLFIKQCNELNKILPELFEKTKDYLELLLSISFTKEEGVIRELITSISEEDFKSQVEIIGWLYQYYNSELKDDTFAQLKKRVKISKEKIPAATQLFTPDWIVKYMVENSLGRLWLEGHPSDDLKANWKYYLDEAEQSPKTQSELNLIKNESKNLKIEEIKIIDPCMGSGHILVYVFDVLMEIYLSQGFNKKDAVISILKNNLYGLDIDDRAYQLAYFAVMMKARSFNRQIFKENIELNLAAIQESNGISQDLINYLSENNADLKRNLEYIKEIFTDAKDFGSLITVKSKQYEDIKSTLLKYKQESLSETKYFEETKEKFLPLVKQGNILSEKYEIVLTNPPYMGNGGMNKRLSDYLKKNFKDFKKDLFATFIEKCNEIAKINGYFAMITQHSFMFLSSYENLRKRLLNNNIINMAHLGARAFEEIGGEVVQTTSFIIRKSNLKNYFSTFVRLIDEPSQKSKEESFLKHENIFITSTDNLSSIPGTPIAYWVEPELINAFRKGTKLSSYADVKKGLSTGNNDIFLRNWFEVEYNKIGINLNTYESIYKWIPINKGGSYRKWYGNNIFIIAWDNDGEMIKKFSQSVIRNKEYYFKQSLTWTMLSSSKFGIRFSPRGYIFEGAGPSIFTQNTKELKLLLGFLSTRIAFKILNLLNPTLNYNIGDIKNLPIFMSDFKNNNRLLDIIKTNIAISKTDWDNFETSWDFKSHFLILTCEKYVENALEKEKNISMTRFNRLKNNEKELNKIFNEYYKLNDETNFEINNEDITINIFSLKEGIKSFLSYFMGCLFGRYSLDQEGLIYAGGEYNPSKYTKFIPDKDNIVPILDTEYFSDDIIKSFEEFLKVAYSPETLEENLKFIANALGNKGKTYRETIRRYFLKDFFNDHKKMYKKTPIYWQFDSGKENGFKALIYMHRYTPDTVARVRTDYLHPLQKALEESINNNDQIIMNSTNSKEKNEATKENIKLKKQLEETRKYDEALGHVANQQIAIDLDDGVKHNYELFQNIEIGNKKIDLLKKI